KYGNALLMLAIEINDLKLMESINKKCLEFFEENKEKNDKVFLEHGTTLLKFAIEMNNLKLIDNVYKECLEILNRDSGSNKIFLSIITTSMQLLNESYPEYVTKFSLDTNMIIDSSEYKIEYLSTPH